jgi:hypothetical protein
MSTILRKTFADRRRARRSEYDTAAQRLGQMVAGELRRAPKGKPTAMAIGEQDTGLCG